MPCPNHNSMLPYNTQAIYTNPFSRTRRNPDATANRLFVMSVPTLSHPGKGPPARMPRSLILFGPKYALFLSWLSMSFL